MNITFRQLRLFLALAETGSVSAAARVMHVTQPTASMQLREVSDNVGVPLYEVVSRRVRLTDAGQDLARSARAMVGEWETFTQRVDGLKGLTRGRLTVAVVSTAQYFMPRLLGSFCQRHPDIDVALQVLNRDGVVARLRDNLDDLYIMSLPPADIDLDDRVFLANPLAVVAPMGHRLARRRSVGLDALRDERFVLRERGSGTRLAADAHFKRLRFAPQVRMELGSNEAVRESVAGQLGLSVLSLHALGPRPADQGVVVLPVEGFPIPSNWHVVRRRVRQRSPIAQAFEAHLVEPATQRLMDSLAPAPRPRAARP
ncbi:MAG: HTH-type transcriptional activator CmpR [Pseudomonadota bacterium]|jgi:DNA-binding transcriptional LysR family regulator